MQDMTIIIQEATKEQPIQTLEVTLMQMNGIERALVDMDDGEVKVSYNENEVNKDQIITHIKQHGLHVLD
ncbi:heavy-metal-associated domain-containing protein [Halalkalibacter urbisdiaboli]|uniref:heavy-metal-associated domain-containing protein n=1 Tax=Halalkalibacter urbisdiaboli TaxID=1960589 RepID=UPI000B43AAF2|nr:heavy-metal-associated domain-containing protein [Halalkalibacter urbisdiaboli]